MSILMKTNFLIILSIITFNFNYSQKTVKMFTEYGSKEKDIKSLMRFQNIELQKIIFEGDDLKGKFYEINLKEFKKGKLINTKNLFDLKISEFLKIDTTFTSLKFFSKIENDKLTVFVESSQMYSDKKSFNLDKGKSSDYLLQNFQGDKEFLNIPFEIDFPILAIITPTDLGDGYSSYCEVAQSEVDPEKFWEKFKIPHYFIIYVKFK